MKAAIATAMFILLVVATPLQAHRLDEYLQATTIAVAKDRVSVELRLTPGVAVFAEVMKSIDPGGDGNIPPARQVAYARQVQRDLSLTIDAVPVPLQITSFTFPDPESMRAGLGEIRLEFQAAVPAGGPARKLIFENHHLKSISVYLVNCLVPGTPDIQITRQIRDYEQTSYQLDYVQTGIEGGQPASITANGSPGQAAASGSLFLGYFLHGVRHILTGYDHLLFIGALVLAARTFWDLVKVVSAFTLAHTLTLTLAALNLVHVPVQVVEPLISASIVFVALQNILWPDQTRGWARIAVAFFFGLFHGLGFAGGLLEAMRELPGSSMLVAILAFSVGVEAGHQLVVLPLFAVIRVIREARPDAMASTRFSLIVQRIGSACITVAGIYYLCLALATG